MMKTPKTTLLCLTAILFLLAALLGGCGEEADGTVSVPQADTLFYVLDEANVLDAATEEHIVAVNDSLCAQQGAQVVVVCVQTTGLASTDEYAHALFNQWQIGDADKNNGVLILLTIGEEDYWTQQGKGLEDTLSSGTIKMMQNQYLEPDFAAGDYDAGVRKMFDAVIAHLESLYSVTVNGGGTAETEPQEEEILYREESNSAILGWAIIIVIVILLIISFSDNGGNHRRRRHVTHSAPRPRKTTYHPYGTRMPGRTSHPTVHRPGSYGGTIGGRTGSSRGGGFSGGSSRGGFSGGGRSGGGGFSRGGGAGRR